MACSTKWQRSSRVTALGAVAASASTRPVSVRAAPNGVANGLRVSP